MKDAQNSSNFNLKFNSEGEGHAVALEREEERLRERGELTQRLTYILLFCHTEPQRVTDLVRLVGGDYAGIRSAIKLLTRGLFIETVQNDGEVFKTTEAGAKWMTTQVRQYHSMFGTEYIRKPPGLRGQGALLKLRSIIKEAQNLAIAVPVEMMGRCLMPVARF